MIMMPVLTTKKTSITESEIKSVSFLIFHFIVAMRYHVTSYGCYT